MVSTRGDLKTVRRGEPITAEWANSLVDALRSMTQISGGPGITVRFGRSGITIARSPQLSELVLCKVRAINDPSGLAPDQPVDLSELSYDIKPYGRSNDPLIPAIIPSLGRPIRGAEVMGYSSYVGDWCMLIRGRNEAGQAEHWLWILNEQPAWGECEAPEAAIQSSTAGVSNLALVLGELEALRRRVGALEGGEA